MMGRVTIRISGSVDIRTLTQLRDRVGGLVGASLDRDDDGMEETYIFADEPRTEAVCKWLADRGFQVIGAPRPIDQI